MKTVLKFILYAGAIASGLAGLWVIYVAIANFREMQYPEWLYVLALEMIYVCLSFTPALMVLKGLKTEKWHWVVIGIVEVIVLALAVYALLVLVSLTLSPG